MAKRFLSLVLSVVLVMTLLPSVFAVDGPVTAANIVSQFAAGGTYYLSTDTEVTNGTLEIPAGKTVTLDLKGFTLSGSGATGDYKNVITVKGNFTLKDSVGTGKVTGGEGRKESGNVNGGGIYVYENGSFTMDGGCITGNSAQLNGGGVFVGENGTFTMNGGMISGNTAECGGGVYNFGGTFVMNDGAISNNTATDAGGGVHNTNVSGYGGIFKMYGGAISGNTAQYNGGIDNFGVLNLTAAADKEITITGNKAAEEVGGVYNGTKNMHLSGKVIIKDNICNNKKYPVNLATRYPIIIDDLLTGSEINITHVDVRDTHNTGVLTSKFKEKNPSASLGDFFTYDGPNTYKMILNTNNELEVIGLYTITNAMPENNKATNNGYITVAASSAYTYDTVTVTDTPNGGYKLKTLKWYKSGTNVESATDITDTKSFTMPDAEVIVVAEFEKEEEPETKKSTSTVVIEIGKKAEEQKEEDNPNTGASVMGIASAIVLAGAALVVSKKHFK